MKTQTVVVDPKVPQPDVIRQAVETLRRGGLVAFPTDTLYALGADALTAEAVERVLTVKGRSRGKPLSVLVPSVEADRHTRRFTEPRAAGPCFAASGPGR